MLRALEKTSSASMLLTSPRSYSARRRSISISQAASTVGDGRFVERFKQQIYEARALFRRESLAALGEFDDLILHSSLLGAGASLFRLANKRLRIKRATREPNVSASNGPSSN